MGDRNDTGLAPMDFSTFVISMASNVMVELGQGPGGDAVTPNLPLAKQTIDILAMLEKKTAGNLSADEEKLLGGVLYQVRLAYVEVRDRG